MFERKAFLETLAGTGIQPRLDIFDELASAYSHPSRHYHTQTHIEDCLANTISAAV